MYIKQLNLQHYRNYQREQFDFSPNLNVVLGKNAQGKTNCVEAIFYLCTGYSPRVTREKQVIYYNQQKCTISLEAVNRYGSLSSMLEFYQNTPKKITVNGLQVQKVGELIGNVSAVLFNPQELKLIQESPEDRRRFLDVALSQINRKYYYNLQKYKKILTQRNTLLKNQDISLIYETLPIWDEQLADCASNIIFDRNEFINLLKPLCEKEHFNISSGSEKLDIKGDYQYNGSISEIKSQLKAEYFARMEKDVEMGYTTIGPHRDDLKIKINDVDVRIYGSQGQQRTCALSLKLAELEIFKQRFGEYPTLILDDAMSELDTTRRKKLIERLDGIQTIITCTDTDSDLINYSNKHFIIENGKISN